MLASVQKTIAKYEQSFAEFDALNDVFDNQVISEAYSREIRKCDPPTPNIPDKNDSKDKGDRQSKSANTASSNPTANAATWYSETETGRKYSLAFDVDLIAYKAPSK